MLPLYSFWRTCAGVQGRGRVQGKGRDENYAMSRWHVLAEQRW